MRRRDSSFGTTIHLAAWICLAACLLPADAFAGGDEFPDNFAECEQMGGTVERDGAHEECRYSITAGDGDAGAAFDECTDRNGEVVGCFGGPNNMSTTRSCSETFRRRVGQSKESSSRDSSNDGASLEASLPETTSAKLDKLQELFAQQNGRWSRETIAELVSERDSLRKGLADRVGSDDSSQRRSAFPLARHVILETGPHTWLVDALESIVKRELDDLTPRLRASALEVLHDISQDHPDKVWMSPRELEASARELTEADDDTATDIANRLLEKMPDE